jgi:hypothetical protein
MYSFVLGASAVDDCSGGNHCTLVFFFPRVHYARHLTGAEMTPYRQVASIIYSQLMATPLVAMCWGINAVCAVPPAVGGGLGGLQFTVRGQKFRGRVLVELMADDTYKVRTFTQRGHNITWGNEVRDVYNDALVNVIDRLVETH